MGLPAVVGLGTITNDVSGGDLMVLDGRQGLVIIEPDEETLARYRARCGNPYMTLTTARALHTLNMRYRHLSTAAQQRTRREREADLERTRRTIFGLE